MSARTGTSAGERVTIIKRNRKGRVRQIAGKHLPFKVRFRLLYDWFKELADPTE